MNFFDVVNGSTMFLLCFLGIIMVFGFAIITGLKSYRRAIEIGMDKKKIRQIIRSTAIFSVVPSFAIVIGLFALAPLLGVAWPWLRLSVIGSVSYELMAADIASNATGVALVNLPSAGLEVMTNIMFVMALCITPGMFVMAIFGNKATGLVNKLTLKESDFSKVAMGCLMLNLLVVFIPDIMSRGLVYTLVLLTSMAATILLGIVMKKYKIMWLRDYIMSFALIIGMTSAVFYSTIIG